MKIICLGNEFAEGDSLAVEVGRILKEEGFDVVHVKDSFGLMDIVSDEKNFVILDVVEGLDCVKEIGVKDLRIDSVLSAHDLDAGFVLGLMDREVRIIGLPREGDVFEVAQHIREKL